MCGCSGTRAIVHRVRGRLSCCVCCGQKDSSPGWGADRGNRALPTCCWPCVGVHCKVHCRQVAQGPGCLHCLDYDPLGWHCLLLRPNTVGGDGELPICKHRPAGLEVRRGCCGAARHQQAEQHERQGCSCCRATNKRTAEPWASAWLLSLPAAAGSLSQPPSLREISCCWCCCCCHAPGSCEAPRASSPQLRSTSEWMPSVQTHRRTAQDMVSG